MRGWALTTTVCEPPDRYYDNIWPLTNPLFEAYAKRWEMDYRPKIITRSEYGIFSNVGTAPHGTASVYASIPFRRQLLNEYDGVVFMDVDNVIVDGSQDICEAVTPERPISTEPNCNCAVMVLLSTPKTKEILDHIWNQREKFRHYQWLEQGAYMQLMGFDPNYPGDNQPPVYLGDTEWTPLRADLPAGWNASPFHPLPDPLRSLHPGGMQPFERRLEVVKDYVFLASTDPWYAALEKT